MTKRFSIVVSVAILAIALWAFYSLAHYSSRGGEQSPLYSVRRHDPYGTAALYELLRARSIPVATLERSRPQSTERGVIIQVLAAPTELSQLLRPQPQLHTESVKQWIMDGNTVIQCTAARTDLMDACRVPDAADPNALDSWSEFERQMRAGNPPSELQWTPIEAQWIGEEADGLPQGAKVVLQSPVPMAVEGGEGWRPMAVGVGAEVLIGAQQVGRGRLIVISSPGPALNDTLGDGANLDMFLAMVGRGPVLIDEWSHGIGHGGTVVGLIKRLGLLPVVFQIAVVVALYSWSTLGHHRSDSNRPPRRRSSAEQVVTLGHLYGQVLSMPVVTLRAKAEVRRRFAAALRCPAHDVERRLAECDDAFRHEATSILAPIEEPTPRTDPVCAQCGYNLRGNLSPNCTECGAPIPTAGRRQIAQSQAAPPPAGSAPPAHRGRTEAHSIHLLKLSHRLTRELTRERQKQRRSGQTPAEAG